MTATYIFAFHAPQCKCCELTEEADASSSSVLAESTMMATPTTLNIGEPADERSVDGNSVPVGDHSAHGSQGGDQELSYDDIKRLGPDVFDDVLSPDKVDLEMDSMEYDDDIEEDSVVDSAEQKSFLMCIFPDILITPSDVCFKISPAIGAVSYGYFSLSVMEPRWFSRAFGEIYRTVGNSLWLQAHVGAGLYIYSRRHIRHLPLKQSIMYSIFGSVLFNFGSCMIWGLGKSFLPTSPLVRMTFGVASSCLLLYMGQDYLQCVDNKCSELE